MAQINNPQGENITNLREYLQEDENISYEDFDKILQTASEIFERCLSPGELGAVQGLIYGHIQSGKTSVILTTIALAADNGYTNFIVMTSNLNDIYAQTLDRVKSSLDSFQVWGKNEFSNNQGNNPGMPLVLVSSKHQGKLGDVSNIIQELHWQNLSVMIIDDEADQASLDTNINQPDKATSAINQAIVNLRGFLNSVVYLQTTATPQALLLQDTQSAFRPDFVVITEPGTGYFGGNYFFGNNDFDNSNHIHIVPSIDLTMLRNSNQIPDTVKDSLIIFFLGAAVLRLKGSRKKYTYLLHTSFKQEDHTQATQLVNRFKIELTNQLKIAVTNSINAISNPLLPKLENAYADLGKTFADLPEFDEVIAEVNRKIPSTEVIEINANTGQGISAHLSRKHTLYIGGTKIGRGVTVKNLLVTYYGRDANQPQMDTVLQHARMYGYRQNEVPAIRIYLPQHLAERFFDIHTSDNLVREQCQITHQAIESIPLPRVGLRPTRRNVLNENTVALVTYQGGRLYFPSRPISDPNELGNQTEELDNLLSPAKYPQTQHPYSVTIDEILEILRFPFATSNTGSNTSGKWKDELIQQSVSALKDSIEKYENTGSLVIVNRNSRLKKAFSRNYAELANVLPGGVGNRPYGVSPNNPALLMSRLTGELDPTGGGWDGVPFWVPVVRFPDGNYAFSVNYS
jgi:hypothetical protein